MYFDLIEFKQSLMRQCIKVTKKEDQDRPILQIKQLVNFEDTFTFILESEGGHHLYKAKIFRATQRYREGELEFKHFRKVSQLVLDYHFMTETISVMLYEDYSVQIMDQYECAKLITLGQSPIPMIRIPKFSLKDYALILT